MFVIINITQPFDPDMFGNECRIPALRRPTFVHFNRDEADAEALRLASLHGGKFAVFAAVAITEERTAMIPTQVWRITELETKAPEPRA